jgi:hypothetical protein
MGRLAPVMRVTQSRPGCCPAHCRMQRYRETLDFTHEEIPLKLTNILITAALA